MSSAPKKLSLKKFEIKQVGAEDGNTFQEAIERFLLSSDSLIDGMPLSIAVLESAALNARQRLFEFVQEFRADGDEPIGLGSSSFKIHVPADQRWKVERLRMKLKRRERALQAVSESFLVALMTQFDTYIGSFAIALLKERPEILNSSKGVLTFTQLNSFSTIEDAMTHLLDEEVDQLLRGGRKKQIGWFEDRIGKGKIPFASRLGSWPDFIEATERRHIIIHCDSRVSRQYIEECEAAGVKLGPASALGAKREIGLLYFAEAHKATSEVGIRLGFIIWLHFRRGDKQVALAHLVELILCYLTEEKYLLAARISEFALELADNYGDDGVKKAITINLAQSHKWLGDEVKMNEALTRQDWSMPDLTCQLALAVLRDQWDRVELAMRKLSKIDGFPAQDYQMWPLFKKMRHDLRFQTLFQELYETPLIDERIEHIPFVPAPADAGTRTSRARGPSRRPPARSSKMIN